MNGDAKPLPQRPPRQTNYVPQPTPPQQMVNSYAPQEPPPQPQPPQHTPQPPKPQEPRLPRHRDDTVQVK